MTDAEYLAEQDRMRPSKEAVFEQRWNADGEWQYIDGQLVRFIPNVPNPFVIIPFHMKDTDAPNS